MNKTVLISLMWLATSGCDRSSEPRFATPPAESFHTIAYLKSLCDNSSSYRITREITIRGHVVANDLYGEFDRSFVVEDDSGGITVAVDDRQTADRYPFGIITTIQCNGLTLCNYGGRILLGTTPDEWGVGHIPREELSRYIRTEIPERIPPAHSIDITAISSRDIDTRVCFERVEFTEGGCWCDTDPETGRSITSEREIVDSRGNRFSVRTLGSCTYAKEPLPQGKGSLYGIIDYFAGKYSLRVGNREILFPSTMDENRHKFH